LRQREKWDEYDNPCFQVPLPADDIKMSSSPHELIQKWAIYHIQVYLLVRKRRERRSTWMGLCNKRKRKKHERSGGNINKTRTPPSKWKKHRGSKTPNESTTEARLYPTSKEGDEKLRRSVEKEKSCWEKVSVMQKVEVIYRSMSNKAIPVSLATTTRFSEARPRLLP
jgi:hypothetical protein